jgi:hypothetical protein
MGKWSARYAEKLGAAPESRTDKTDERRVLSVLAVPPEGGANDSQGERRLVDMSAVAWTDRDIRAFLDRRSRLLRWGWSEPQAEALADRLTRRDREQDERVSCIDCLHYRPGLCGNHRQADLSVPEVGMDWAAFLQRCFGFQPGRQTE